MDGDLNQHVLRRRLGVFHEDIEIAVLVKHPRVEQLVFRLAAAAAAVRRDQIAIREGRLGILVEVLHVRVGRRRVEVEVVFLHVLAVVPLAVGQPEQAFLEDRILPVPQRQREAEPLAVVGNAGQAVFAPAVGARTGLVVGEVVPGIAACRCSPRARCPTAARSGRAPTSSRGCRPRGRRSAASAPSRQ